MLTLLPKKVLLKKYNNFLLLESDLYDPVTLFFSLLNSSFHFLRFMEVLNGEPDNTPPVDCGTSLLFN